MEMKYSKKPSYLDNKCKCCLTNRHILKDLWDVNLVEGDTWVYGDMIAKCFAISWQKPVAHTELICESCVKTLLIAFKFKRDVLASEQILLEQLEDEDNECNETVQEDMADDNIIHEDLIPDEDSENRAVERFEETVIETKMEDLRHFEAVCLDGSISVEPVEKGKDQTSLPQQENTNENENCTEKHLENCLKAITSNKLVPIVVLERYSPKKTEQLKQGKIKATDISKNQGVSSHLKKTHKDKEDLTEITSLVKTGIKVVDYELQRLPSQSEHSSKKINAGIANERHSSQQTQQYSAEDLQLCLDAVKSKRLTATAASVLYDIPLNTLNRILARDEDERNVNAHFGQTMPSSSSLTQHKCARAASTSSRDIEEQGEQAANKFTCDICKGDFKRKHSLFKHMMLIHKFVSKSKILSTCKTCNKQFSNSSDLIQHQRIHTGEKPYSCKICNKQFSRSWSLIRHQRIHISKKPYSCQICSKQFSDSSALITHQRAHTGNKPYSCKICNKQFSRSWSLIRHQRIHISKKPYSCQICSKQFSDSSALITHQRAHTGNKPYSCKICYKLFSQSWALIRHQHTHTGEKPYSCKICSKQFSQNTNLLRHQSVHSGNKPYSCKICNKQFSDSSSLIRHQRIHTGEKPYSCQICSKQFSDSSSLITHQRIHTGEKPYSCKICKKKFSDISCLTRHQRIHTGNKPYPCKICSKQFSDSSALVTHQRIHTGEKPYSCKICNKKFTRSSHLITHQRVHTGEKPYSCKICSKQFSDSSALIKHQRIHTGEKPYSCKICSKQFSYSSALIKHQRIHTGERPYSCKSCFKKFSQSSHLMTHQRVHSVDKTSS